MALRLLDNQEVSASGPIIILGPNGIGKTRLSVALARHNAAERVSALRFIELSEVPMKTYTNASNETKQVLQNMLGTYWSLSQELRNLMSEIIAEDREAAVEYRDLKSTNPNAATPDKLVNTRKKKITDIWNNTFPGREIKLGYEPTVTRTLEGRSETYSTGRMSEGERTALYLAARIVSCGTSVMFVDEPETYFHPLLARQLWNELQSSAPNIQFVFITHDIPFALSRSGATFLIARSESSVDILAGTDDIPSDVVAQVLGAASFSVSATRLIFCEGEEGGPDKRFYSAWYQCRDTAVIPVGSCNAVRECVSVFRDGRATKNVEAFGHIDRDSWPEAYLTEQVYVKPLPVSEIEGVHCIRAIFLALATFNGIETANASRLYEDFLRAAKASFSGIVFNKEVLNRARARVEREQRAFLNTLNPQQDLTAMRSAFSGAGPSGGWSVYFDRVFNEEEQRLAVARTGNEVEFLKSVPAKLYSAQAASRLNVQEEAIRRDVERALLLTEKDAPREQGLAALRDAIVESMSPHLWPRKRPSNGALRSL